MSSVVIVVGWLTILACTLIGVAGLYIFALERWWSAVKRRRDWAAIKTALVQYDRKSKETLTKEQQQ